METAKTVLFGNGEATKLVAEDLLHKGIEVIIATPQKEVFFDSADDVAAELLTGVTLKNCSVVNGGYALTFAKESKIISREAHRIVLCDDYKRVPEFSRYGLSACDQVISLSQFIAEPETFSRRDGSIVFLTGIYRESNALILRTTMESAKYLANDHAQKVYILTGNLKVAAQGLEALCREARLAGVTIVKFNREKPSIEQVENGGATITFKDEITDHLFRLSPGLTIVDEILCVSETTQKMAEMLSIDQDPQGFAQTGNVHRLPVSTNRRGVFVAGPSRAVLAPEYQAMDMDSVSLALAIQSPKNAVPGGAYAEIDSGQCVRCLTCYRICPYRAITIDGRRVQVKQKACEGCGICFAECPKCAIRMEGQTVCTPAQQIETGEPAKDANKLEPTIFAFCCARSAVQAAHLASSMGLGHPEGLRMIEVPCSGMISAGCLLDAFQNGADGVLVLTCHDGNCHAENGNTYAHQRTRYVGDLLGQIGLEKSRLLKSTLASNMGFEFSDIVNGFADTLKQMGPLRNK
jgi:quinone-modifying oxidoreductase subunit QmoB